MSGVDEHETQLGDPYADGLIEIRDGLRVQTRIAGGVQQIPDGPARRLHDDLPLRRAYALQQPAIVGRQIVPREPQNLLDELSAPSRSGWGKLSSARTLTRTQPRARTAVVALATGA